MELKMYFGIVVKRLWVLLLLLVVIGCLTAYISFYVLKPVYETSTSLFVVSKINNSQTSIDYNDILVSQLLVNDYRELIISRTVTAAVINELGIGNITPKALADKIKVNSKSDTRVIKIEVQGEDPKQLQVITDKLAAVFMIKAVELMKVENVAVIDKAEFPEDPVKPKPIMNILISVFVSLLLGTGLMILIEYLDDTIKTSDDVEQYLGLTLLGTIPVIQIR